MTGAEPYPPLILSSVDLTLSTGFGWYVLTSVVLLAAAYLVYRYTLPPVEQWRRALLWTLRGLALIMVALLIFEPVLSYVFSRRQAPVVALLVDRSASIVGSDSGRVRQGVLSQWLRSTTANLPNDLVLRTFAFADSVSAVPVDSLSLVAFDGVGTDIAGAVDRARRLLADQPLVAVVLVSDGAYNGGENPVRVASESTVPIHTIGIGDTAAFRDLTISQLLTNDVAYVGSTVPVDIRVHARGYRGQMTTLRLLGPKGESLSQETVRFLDEDSELAYRLNFAADAPGDRRVTVVLEPLPGESVTDNNRRSAIVRVLESKSQVLLFSGPPTADLTTLRQTLDADTSVEVSAFIEASNGAFLSGRSAPSDDELGSSDLIVLLNFPSSATSPTLLDRLGKALDGGMSVLFLTGPQLSVSHLNALKAAMPFNAKKQALSEERVVLREAAGHPALSSRSPLGREWKDLPPVLGGLDNFTVRPPAQVAAKLSRESLGLTEEEPAVVLWQANRQRGAAVLCWGLFRWKLQRTSSETSFYEQMIPRLVSWLIAPTDEQQVRIRTNKRLYSGGERVQFVAQVYGADFTPRDDAMINLRVTSGDRSETVALRNRGNGRFEGSFGPWAEGDFAFAGTAISGSDTLGRDQGLFAVEPFNVELVDPRARFDILQGMSNLSGGSFVPLDRADSLMSSLRFQPRDVSSRLEIPLWNRAWVVWIIIALLSVEWIVRKRSGML